jgi:hypothetical protein
MFGRNWQPATATIISKTFHESTETAGTYEYEADVALTSGERFRATLKQPVLMSHIVRLSEGTQVNVLADAGRKRAKFDRDDPQINGKPTS